jgi:hypothetical protein
LLGAWTPQQCANFLAQLRGQRCLAAVAGVAVSFVQLSTQRSQHVAHRQVSERQQGIHLGLGSSAAATAVGGMVVCFAKLALQELGQLQDREVCAGYRPSRGTRQSWLTGRGASTVWGSTEYPQRAMPLQPIHTPQPTWFAFRVAPTIFVSA